MKIVLTLFAVLAATPVLADDGHVSSSTLNQLGLGEMKVITDEEGHAVRGMSSNAFAHGLNVMMAVVQDPATPGNFLAAADNQSSAASATNAGNQVVSGAMSGFNGSAIAGSLTVQNNAAFAALFGGLAGTAANPGNAGFAFGFAQ